MNITREEALTLMAQAKDRKDYELANMYFELVCWLDRKAGVA